MQQVHLEMMRALVSVQADLGIDLITIVPDKADTSVDVRLLPDVGGSWIATRQGYGLLPNDGLKMNNFLVRSSVLPAV